MNGFTRRASIRLVLVIAFAVLASPAVAEAAPANDNFANAQTITGYTTGNNIGATFETGEPFHGFEIYAGHSVWYKWTPGSTERVILDGCDSAATGGGNATNPSLAVYTGSAVDSLASVGRKHCRTSFVPKIGTVYKIAVDMPFGGNFSFDLYQLPPPANDNFAAAQNLAGSPPVTAGTNQGGTAEPGEPDHTGFEGGGASVWYSWTAPSTATAHIDVCDSGGEYQFPLAVYTGSTVSSLTQAAFSHGSCQLKFAATSGTTYRIAVDDDGNYVNKFNLSLTMGAPAPANDDFADAFVLPVDVPTKTGTTVDATAQPDEPYSGASSVWYRWTATYDTQVKLKICGGGEGEYGTVFTGSALKTLVPIDMKNYGYCGDEPPTFDATEGTTYSIAVNGPEGAFTLTLIPGRAPVHEEPYKAKPVNTKISVAKIKSSKGKVKFKFTGSGGSGHLHYECKLTGQSKQQNKWLWCKSPKTYRRLKQGKHVFKVRTKDQFGHADKSPAKKIFRIPK